MCLGAAPKGGARALLRAGWKVEGHGTRDVPNTATSSNVCPACRPVVERYVYAIGQAPRRVD